MRLCLEHKDSEKLNRRNNMRLGADPEKQNVIEYHQIQFERYFKMPQELAEFKTKLLSQAKDNSALRGQIE